MSGIPEYRKSADRMGAHGTVARRAVEFSYMGVLLWRALDLGKICVGRKDRKIAGMVPASIYIDTGIDRLGIFLQSVVGCGNGLSRRDVRCGSQRSDRQSGILFPYDTLAFVPALCGRLVSSRNEYSSDFDKLLREQKRQTGGGMCRLYRNVSGKPCIPGDRKFSAIFIF